MDKKEKKRDIASFAHNLKEVMSSNLEIPLSTLDRDLQHFLYGRIAILIKHNEGQPIGSLSDVGAVVGSALGSVVAAFCENRSESHNLDELFSSIKDGFNYGFDMRLSTMTTSSNESTTSEEEFKEVTPVE